MMMRLSVIKAFHIAIAKCAETLRRQNSGFPSVEKSAAVIYPTPISV
jgi:hypothetical protein